MQLIEMRNEVLARGFDPIAFISRITMFLNDAQNTVARRADYYGAVVTLQTPTTAGSATIPMPTDLGRIRNIFDVDRRVNLEPVSLRDIDGSAVITGAPIYYTILSAALLDLYPTPDAVYNLRVRYWKMPTQLVNDTDVPSLPADYHSMLITYATAMCYSVDDDPQTGSQWMQMWEKQLSQFAADVKFPDTDTPNQVRGMWDQDTDLSGSGWTRAGF